MLPSIKRFTLLSAFCSLLSPFSSVWFPVILSFSPMFHLLNYFLLDFYFSFIFPLQTRAHIRTLFVFSIISLYFSIKNTSFLNKKEESFNAVVFFLFSFVIVVNMCNKNSFPSHCVCVPITQISLLPFPKNVLDSFVANEGVILS